LEVTKVTSVAAETIALQLARFVAVLNYDDLPIDVVNQTKALVLDQLGVELIGSTLEWTQPVLKLVEYAPSTNNESTIVNYGNKTVAWDAAFVNATFGQGCELDDMAFGSAGHIGTATIPAALAVGEREHINGKQFIASIVAGYEVMYRLMAAVHPHHAVRGFQSQGIGGPFAAAAVAGKILSLTEHEMVNAFGIAGSHSSGSLEYDQSGGEVKRMHAGLAARGGIQSAVLAQYGLTGPATIIEGKRGFCHIFADNANPDLIVKDLGRTFKIRNMWIKMYPAIATIHTAIAAIAELTDEYDIRSDKVVDIRVGIAEHSLLHGAAIYQPTDVTSAQFSLGFSIGLRIAKRSNDLKLYMDPKLWNDDEIIGLAQKVKPYAHPDAHGDKRTLACVDIKLSDGRTVHGSQEFPRGSPKNPVREEELYQKFRTLAASVLTKEQIAELIPMVETVEELDDMSILASHLVRKS
jgi:2-methylcitrate dehydratase PrpD